MFVDCLKYPNYFIKLFKQFSIIKVENDELMGEALVYIASILHDVGKLISKSKTYRELFDESHDYRKIESREKSAGYYHAYIGAWWLENFAGKDFFDQRGNQKITNIVAHHHRRDLESLDKETLSVILADWLASGERMEKDDEGAQFLLNAFYSIGDGVQRFYYRPASLGEMDYFPKCKEELNPEDYHKLISSFERCLVEIFKGASLSSELYFNPLFESLYNALFNYCWAVPAQTGRAGYEANISLFSHSKLTAAIAPIVYRLLTRDEILKVLRNIASGNTSELLKKPLFSLVVGDMSGIQKFIFNVPSQGAAKSLKGRSAYVDLLGEAIARFVIKKFNLSRANLLMFGGGGFQILTPLVDDETFDSVKEKVEKVLFKHHGVGIYMALSRVDLSMEDFLSPERYRDKVEESRVKGALEKYRKYTFIRDLFEESLVVSGDERKVTHKRCSVCGVPVKREKIDEEDGLCELCQSIARLGSRLKEEGNFLIITRSDEGKGYNAVFAEFGFNFRFRREPWDKALNFCVNRFPEKLKEWKNVNGIRFLPKGATPGVTFQEIAEKSKGIKKLGVLKLDVDNLGYLFGKGLGAKYTPSLVDTISNMLNVFFSLEVEKILDELSKGEDVFYLVFSGGDDCFLLGAWDRVFDAAHHIKQRFDRFVCNPVVTFSSAFTIVGDKTPMIKIANLIEERLKDAKSERKSETQPPEKDKISVIGYVVPMKKGELSFEKLFGFYKTLISHNKEVVKKMFNAVRVIYEGLLYVKPEDLDLVRRIWLFGYMMRDYIEKGDELVTRIYGLNQSCVFKSIRERKEHWKFIYVLLRLSEFYMREER